jgi:hypothetical protein
MLAATGFGVVVDRPDLEHHSEQTAVAARFDIPEVPLFVIPQPQPGPAETAPPPPAAPPQAPKPEPPPAPPPPAPERKLQSIPKSEVVPLDLETAQHIEAINLTPEGYQQFFQNLDMTWFGYTQGHNKFNPARVPIPQHRTQFVTAHFTAEYTNALGLDKSQPIGDMDVKRLVDWEASRGGPVCCAMNFIIDRNGHVFQLAPFNAKLRHNPPFDGITTGYEVEATWQNTVTPKQFEAATYLTLAMLVNEHLLGTKSIGDLFAGHGEVRDKLRAEHPEMRKWGIRNDFDEPVMQAWRTKVEAFIQANPNLAELTHPLH